MDAGDDGDDDFADEDALGAVELPEGSADRSLPQPATSADSAVRVIRTESGVRTLPTLPDSDLPDALFDALLNYG